ncbi:hypothetical protein H257_02931 [Aphanomyces astaci]|uniref:Uncharacterized protein n=1 Tax=Aphanomyces astaci TaxID=112090 RepID=W4H1E1_APHAT|nr:hypothetical protein H257_02931 [Aphanomyces astaci]ETV85054.1 hypothetical protein H257_02931 [Aphanomyces astaci]|eukprot:XP_009825072.1 hypothetical protein H257_02931 [Aphanomyces astaci]
MQVGHAELVHGMYISPLLTRFQGLEAVAGFCTCSCRFSPKSAVSVPRQRYVLARVQLYQTFLGDLCNLRLGTSASPAFGLLAHSIALAKDYSSPSSVKRFEMANTTARQVRCPSTDSDNTAVHLEAILRNFRWSDFNTAIASGVRELRGGIDWLASVPDAFADVASEAALWRSKNATR